MKCFGILVLSLLLCLTGSAQITLVLQPGPTDGIDSDIRDDQPSTPNGNSPDFAANAWSSGGSFIERSLIRFDLSSIPSGSTIISATLSLYANPTSGHTQHHSSLSGPNTCLLKRVITDWSESLVTWSNQPSTTSQNLVVIPQSTSSLQDYPNIDVTALITDMLENPDSSFGMMLQLQTEVNYRSMIFASSDNANGAIRPKLEVVYGNCTPPVSGFSYNANNLNVSFTNLSTGAVSWLWDFGDGFTSILQNPVHIYQSQGTYSVCLSAISDSCGTNVVCDTIEICSNPIPEFDYTNNNLTVQFNNLTLNYLNCMWDLGDGTFTSLVNPQHTYVTNGIYKVCLITTNNCGSDSTCHFVDLLGTGIHKYSHLDWSVFPSPTYGIIYIVSPVDDKCRINIYSTQGELIISTISCLSSKSLVEIDISSLTSGLYLLDIQGKDFLFHDMVVKLK